MFDSLSRDLPSHCLQVVRQKQHRQAVRTKGFKARTAYLAQVKGYKGSKEGLLIERQSKREYAAFTKRALGVNGSAVRLDQLLGDSQSQPRAAGAAGA